MTVTVFGNLTFIPIECYEPNVSIFSLVLDLIAKTYQTLKTELNHRSKHLRIHQKYSAIHYRTMINYLTGLLANNRFLFLLVAQYIHIFGDTQHLS